MTQARSKTNLNAVLAIAGGMFLLARLARRHSPARGRRHPEAGKTGLNPTQHKVVVVGAGFGGLQASLRFARCAGIDLTLIDAHNHHLFQPLLYQVATAALSPSDIASPVRGIIPASSHARVIMATVTGVNIESRHVVCDVGAIPYDDLIIATGSRPSYFRHPDWAQAAHSLKTLDDALDVRTRILGAFERASTAGNLDERARQLTFVLVGGGPTGVEMAGSIAELVRDTLPRDYGTAASEARIILIEAGPRVLNGFPPDLSRNAAQALASLGVEIRTGSRVTGIDRARVSLHNESIPAATVLWTAGTEATPVAEWLGVKPGHGGRVPVDANLSVADHPEIRVIGDAALVTGQDGKPLPGLAPVAKQQGRYVSRIIIGRLAGRRLSPFRYRDYGNLATIGRNRAVAEFGRVHLTGTPAWLAWAAAHIFFLISYRNRVMVTAQWAFTYATRRRGGQLITGRSSEGSATMALLPGHPPPVAKPG